jgi:hypothetical protein
VGVRNLQNKRVWYSNSTPIFQFELVVLCNLQNKKVWYSNSTLIFQFELVGLECAWMNKT